VLGEKISNKFQHAFFADARYITVSSVERENICNLHEKQFIEG